MNDADVHRLEGLDASNQVGGLIVKKKKTSDDKDVVFKKPEITTSLLGLDKLAEEKVDLLLN